MKNLHKVISAEIERLNGLRPMTTVQQAARVGASLKRNSIKNAFILLLIHALNEFFFIFIKFT